MREIDVEDAVLLEAALCRQNIADFTRKVFKTVSPEVSYIHNWHIDCIAEHLHAVHDGDLRRLIINMPPRSLKSMLVSVSFPAWLLGKDPTKRIIAASYSQILSLKHSLDTRLVIESGWYKRMFPDTRIGKDQNEKSKFMTTQRGFRFATSVGGTATGEGGSLLIVDDPHNPTEAESDVERQTALDWFDRTFMTRMDDKRSGAVVVVMQRLHTNDLTGHLLEKDNGWNLLKLPAEAHAKIIIDLGEHHWKMQEGELLQPEREPKEVLQQLASDLGSYAYAGQYSQSPVPLGGGEFKGGDLNYYDEKLDGSDSNIYILVDPANAKKKTSDYTAMVVMGLAPDNNYYVLDLIRDRLNKPERVNALINLHKKWNKLSGRPPKVGYEQYGRDDDDFAIKTKQKEISYRFPITILSGKRPKPDRIRDLLPIVEDKRLYLPHVLYYTDYSGKQKDLVHELVHSEMLTFPVAIHDDLLDALARICDEGLSASFPRLQQQTFYRNVDGLDRLSPQGDDWGAW